MNKEVGKLADALLAILQKQRAQMEQNAPPPLIPLKPGKVEAANVSSIEDPGWRETMRKTTLALAAI